MKVLLEAVSTDTDPTCPAGVATRRATRCFPSVALPFASSPSANIIPGSSAHAPGDPFLSRRQAAFRAERVRERHWSSEAAHCHVYRRRTGAESPEQRPRSSRVWALQAKHHGKTWISELLCFIHLHLLPCVLLASTSSSAPARAVWLRLLSEKKKKGGNTNPSGRA
ncbi:unnamed protein product [Pleuronectes platessa]|uniref:Uncharacterized protein n=1 Tax=Pleuronectes platessa TaxID=8262 RepID=A0A9N7VCU3_PLEPL|nr:unnamed protein product [Pleuronectes platessa]